MLPVRGLIKRERERQHQPNHSNSYSGDMRKGQFHHNNNNHKRHKPFPNPTFDDSSKNGKPQSKNGQGGEKDRVYHCRRCPNNHPGKDCEGNPVTYNYCGIKGQRAYECYKKLGRNGPHNGNGVAS